MNKVKIKKVFFIGLFILSLVINALLAYYLYDNLKPAPSLMKFGFSEHNIVVYFEIAEDVTSTKIDFNEGIYKVGDAEIQYKDDLCLSSPDGKINLSEIGGEAFVINSDGKLLYQLVKPENASDGKNTETVFVTPSGKKYHSDYYCAGRSAFETEKETAVLFGRASCSVCYCE